MGDGSEVPGGQSGIPHRSTIPGGATPPQTTPKTASPAMRFAPDSTKEDHWEANLIFKLN